MGRLIKHFLNTKTLSHKVVIAVGKFHKVNIAAGNYRRRQNIAKQLSPKANIA